MLPERKEKQNQKGGWDILHFEIKQMVKFTMKVSLGTDKASLSKMTSLENKKATLYKCSTTFNLYQELILCFHYILGQPKFSIPLKVKCYYSELISIVDTATITPVITPFVFLQTIGEHYLTHMTKNWDGWDVHHEMTIWINKTHSKPVWWRRESVYIWILHSNRLNCVHWRDWNDGERCLRTTPLPKNTSSEEQFPEIRKLSRGFEPRRDAPSTITIISLDQFFISIAIMGRLG